MTTLFTGTSELWANGNKLDEVKFSGGERTVEFIIDSTREDLVHLHKSNPGLAFIKPSHTFWFD